MDKKQLKMETLIDIRICYEIEGNEENLKAADLLYREWQYQFKRDFPKAKLNLVHIAKSKVKEE